MQARYTLDIAPGAVLKRAMIITIISPNRTSTVLMGDSISPPQWRAAPLRHFALMDVGLTWDFWALGLR